MIVTKIINNIGNKIQQHEISNFARNNIFISDDLSPNIAKMLKDAKQEIGTFAFDNDLQISFLKSDKFEPSTIINVDRIEPLNIEEGYYQPLKHVGKAKIAEHNQNKFLKDLMGKLTYLAKRAELDRTNDKSEPYFFTPYYF